MIKASLCSSSLFPALISGRWSPLFPPPPLLIFLFSRQTFQALREDEDITLKEYLKRQQAPQVLVDLLDAAICNDWCSSVGRTALRELLSCEANKAGLTVDAAWRFGTSEIFPKEGITPFVQHLAQDVPIYLCKPGDGLRRAGNFFFHKLIPYTPLLSLPAHQVTNVWYDGESGVCCKLNITAVVVIEQRVSFSSFYSSCCLSTS